ncbi:glycosyltransferase [Patescibacteria group bacterium]|nr:glycosyltransferase [Patescibacteria group bacterium]
MKILYVNDNDLAGRRFNGHDLQIMLNKKKGYSAKQFVISKAGDNENTIPMIKTNGGYFIREKCMEFHNKISMQSVVYPFGELIAESEEFKEADIVHYHLIFNYFISLYSFKKLTEMKPTVWTLHDPWALTGHCVHPVDCKGWLTGCKNCPYLDRYAPLKEDNASSIWNIKKDIYKDLDIDIVVASQWMYDMVKKSPLTKHFERVHLIPFGIDLDLFKRREDREKIRKKIGINKENFVIMFRQDPQEWKGLLYIKEMLTKLKTKKEVTILTVGETGLLEELKDKYQVIEYEWVNDNNLMVELYSASDLFLMPSVAEAFGLMAVEAMACSLPVIVFEGTSLPSVTFSPKCGIALKRGDTDGFVQTVNRLISDPKECRERGNLGEELTVEHYKIERYNKQLIELYTQIYFESKKK